MHTLILITHVVVSIFLIVIVLLQHGKGADMGATFGGGSGGTVFGTEGPLPLMNKITTASAVIFMLTSVTLAYYSANATKSSVMKSLRETAPVEKKVDVAPTPVEVPMTGNKQAKGEDKATTPAQFPGKKVPASAPTTPAPSNSGQAKQPDSHSKETAPAPAPEK
jgi:preprotein translocase subunit SecG